MTPASELCIVLKPNDVVQILFRFSAMDLTSRIGDIIMNINIHTWAVCQTNVVNGDNTILSTTYSLKSNNDVSTFWWKHIYARFKPVVEYRWNESRQLLLNGIDSQ